MTDEEWEGEERRFYKNNDRREVCFLHRDHIKSIDEQLTVIGAKLLEYSDFKAQAQIVGVIAALIFMASFVYTADHKAESGDRLRTLEAKVTANRDSLAEVRGDYKALLVEMRGIKDETRGTNVRLTQLINIIRTGKTSPFDEVENDGY